jgi:hypothetical protein
MQSRSALTPILQDIVIHAYTSVTSSYHLQNIVQREDAHTEQNREHKRDVHKKPSECPN